MNASQIMTTPVVTIGPDSQVREIAALLLKHRISGVPVVDGGRLVAPSHGGCGCWAVMPRLPTTSNRTPGGRATS